jgi:hypothetical protein
MFLQVETVILADGFCKKTMAEKRGKYKQKQKNVQRLKLFLKKVQDGKLNQLGKNIRKH